MAAIGWPERWPPLLGRRDGCLGWCCCGRLQGCTPVEMGGQRFRDVCGTERSIDTMTPIPPGVARPRTSGPSRTTVVRSAGSRTTTSFESTPSRGETSRSGFACTRTWGSNRRSACGPSSRNEGLRPGDLEARRDSPRSIDEPPHSRLTKIRRRRSSRNQQYETPVVFVSKNRPINPQ